jgi:hypothetical protein
MSHIDGNATQDADAVAASAFDTVEIVSRVSDALGALADLIREVSGGLAGASIAKSDHGTLLLNQRAWDLFGELLRDRIPDLRIVQPAHASSKPLKYVLTANPLPPNAAQMPVLLRD